MASESIYLRVGKGAFVPADSQSAQQLRERTFRTGDVVKARISKLRNTKFNRLVHKIGQMVSANIESFSGLDAHMCIKRLQIEARVECKMVLCIVPGTGETVMHIPQSLSFDSMGEERFQAAAKAICRHIADKYWPTLTAEQVESMAECFVDE